MLVDRRSIAACRARRDRLVADLGLAGGADDSARCIGMRLRGAARGPGPAEAAGVARMVESSDEIGMFPLLWHAQSQVSPQVGDLGTKIALAVSSYAGDRMAALERQRSRGPRGQGVSRSQSYGAGSDSRR